MQKQYDHDTKPLDPNCKHELKVCAYWDGYDKDGKLISGVYYRCTKCKGITNLGRAKNVGNKNI